jgi:hypothetical protein
MSEQINVEEAQKKGRELIAAWPNGCCAVLVFDHLF